MEEVDLSSFSISNKLRNQNNPKIKKTKVAAILAQLIIIEEKAFINLQRISNS